MSEDKIIILGAGPAGMACAYTLTEANQKPLVIEKDSVPGGMCRTINYHGYLFDIGGHRFLTRLEKINTLWRKVMDGDMLKVRRISRIYYRKRYFNYPLTFINTFRNLGIIEGFLCIASYLKYKVKPINNNTFQGWITNHFGKRLFEIFFKPYTEKVWAMASQDLSADWAKERIKGLSLKVAIQKAVFRNKSGVPRTLSEEFLYPKTGPGEFYHRFYNMISECKGEFVFGKNIIRIRHVKQKIISIETQNTSNHKKEELPVDYLFSSIPLPLFINILDPLAPNEILNSAQKLQFRSLLTVNIILNKDQLFPDQWIYVHSPNVKLGRIQNYKNWSPSMVVDPKKTSLGLEYFCSPQDKLWEMNELDLVNFAVDELEKIGVTSRRWLIGGFVVRQPNAYPTYSLNYSLYRNLIRKYLSGFSNLQMMGRAGLFRYDNSDYAMLTGIYSAKNYLNEDKHDNWEIKIGGDYSES